MKNDITSLAERIGRLALDFDLAVEREPDREKRIRLKAAHNKLCEAVLCMIDDPDCEKMRA